MDVLRKLTWVLLLAATLQAAAESPYNNSSDKIKVLSQVRSGAANYHPTYASIINTVVTIQGFYVRTNDGKVIAVPSPRMIVDLQDLNGPLGTYKGLRLDLRKIAFPGRAPTIDLVEVEARIVDCSDNYLNLSGMTPQFGRQCRLNAPKSLFLYMDAKPEAVTNDEYIVRFDFSPLNAVQLDLVTTTTQATSCWQAFPEMPPICKPVGRPMTSTVKSCELVNRRHPIKMISRVVDEL